VTNPFQTISMGALDALVAELASGRLGAPSLSLGVPQIVRDGQAECVVGALERLFSWGLTPDQVAEVLRLLLSERQQGQRAADRVELVWTGPEGMGNQSRHTSVVMNELFAAATEFVLVSGYAVYHGKQVFAVLGRRMDEILGLRVQLFLNAARTHGDGRSDPEVLREFADDFCRTQWPGRRLPEVFYDPRALAKTPGSKACLHAKCVVVDGRRAFVTSANLTEAAQERNIEAGVLIEDEGFSRSLTAQFENLVNAGLLKRVPGL
jgi:phosphatidylserine/phosphatidylglycerophosphate/cardiolipin synthase-like enzyme